MAKTGDLTWPPVGTFSWPRTGTSSATSASAATSSVQAATATDVAGLTALAKKLGCTDPKVTAAKAGTDAAKAGATAATTCKGDGAEYVLAATKNPSGVAGLVKSFGDSVSGGSKVYYVVGPTWFALGSTDGNDVSESVAKSIQSKIGGEVKTLD